MQFVSACYKTQKMCNKVTSEEPFILNYCLGRYKTRDMCGKAVDACLPTLKFVPDWFITNKILEKVDNLVFCNDDIDFDDIDPDIVTLFNDDMGLATIDLNDINLDYDKFDEGDPTNFVLVRLIAWCNIFLNICLNICIKNNGKQVKKDRCRINAYIMASKKSVVLVYDKR